MHPHPHRHLSRPRVITLQRLSDYHDVHGWIEAMEDSYLCIAACSNASWVSSCNAKSVMIVSRMGLKIFTTLKKNMVRISDLPGNTQALSPGKIAAPRLVARYVLESDFFELDGFLIVPTNQSPMTVIHL